MNCHDCRQANGPERAYCGACGASLVRFCARCGFRNGSTDRYCGGCGAALAETAGLGFVPVANGTTPSPGSAGGGVVEELLAAAEEAVREDAGGGDIRVDQDDIDSLFGD